MAMTESNMNEKQVLKENISGGEGHSSRENLSREAFNEGMKCTGRGAGKAAGEAAAAAGAMAAGQAIKDGLPNLIIHEGKQAGCCDAKEAGKIAADSINKVYRDGAQSGKSAGDSINKTYPHEGQSGKGAADSMNKAADGWQSGKGAADSMNKAADGWQSGKNAADSINKVYRDGAQSGKSAGDSLYKTDPNQKSYLKDFQSSGGSHKAGYGDKALQKGYVSSDHNLDE
jgi:hypothetical protein